MTRRKRKTDQSRGESLALPPTLTRYNSQIYSLNPYDLSLKRWSNVSEASKERHGNKPPFRPFHRASMKMRFPGVASLNVVRRGAGNPDLHITTPMTSSMKTDPIPGSHGDFPVGGGRQPDTLRMHPSCEHVGIPPCCSKHHSQRRH